MATFVARPNRLSIGCGFGSKTGRWNRQSTIQTNVNGCHKVGLHLSERDVYFCSPTGSSFYWMRIRIEAKTGRWNTQATIQTNENGCHKVGLHLSERDGYFCSPTESPFYCMWIQIVAKTGRWNTQATIHTNGNGCHRVGLHLSERDGYFLKTISRRELQFLWQLEQTLCVLGSCVC